MSTPQEIARTAAEAADSKKAQDVAVIDVTGKSDVCDCIVVATVANNPQAHAVMDAVEEAVRTGCGVKPLSVEGRDGMSWVLIDYGPVVVHVFKPEQRAFYRIENLWADAPRIEI
ncbi:ribosome silencing factor [Coriobacteriaceae bacterium]|uniref:Ribosomal silencing factor RsfS n=1 Tax=Granulimonas faecalis TaxID=2894155 RepID=A0AAV5B1J0_9ACTN|nr:ribosome silencing factor [Granulimonas faecalis]TGY60677.1 ribosome silencing factor [Coriobacteriaceae bacterium]GJM55401.1 ribosomal silencing factor RsfS [Granulimonas faecalis]